MSQATVRVPAEDPAAIRDPRSSPGRRRAALQDVAERLLRNRAVLADRLVGSRLRVHALAHQEVEAAVRRLLTLAESDDAITGRRPVGTVALLLPSNAALVAPLKAIASAYLCGNQVRVRFPRRTAWLGDVLRDVLVPLNREVVIVDLPGPDFLRTQLAHGESDVVLAYGDDRWATGYEPLARHSTGKFIFEGPGKDPFLVLPGTDLDHAAAAAVRSGFYNGGQACTSPERFYVHESLLPDFVERVLTRVGALVVGPAEDPRTDIGPFTNPEVVSRFLAQVERAMAHGARLLWPAPPTPIARPADGEGTLLQPVVLTDVHHGMPLVRDETFGPALPICPVVSVDQAVALAEDSDYGLTASVFGSSSAAASRLRRTHGVVFENETWHEFYEREPFGPMGGFKRSGWVWEWRDGSFIRREGPRWMLKEFSRPGTTTGGES